MKSAIEIRSLRIVVATLVACSSAAPPAAPSRPAPSRPATGVLPDLFPAQGPVRLPHTFEPTGYRVRIAPREHDFIGHIEIDGDLAEPTQLIWLNGVDLTLSGAVATRGDERIALEFTQPRRDQLVGLRAQQPLAGGRWTIVIDYTGLIQNQAPPDPRAFYGPRDPYSIGLFRRVIGVDTYLFTQSEAIGARQIFPCLDEPDRKVPWQLTLDIHDGLVAASNTPIATTTRIDATHQRVEFAPTRPLPSYLIAFAIGPFDIVEDKTSTPPIRVLAARGRSARAAWIPKRAASDVAALVDYTAIPFPYPKLDFVVVPNLGMGAMENAGLITISDRLAESPDEYSVVTHEVAHQWFGDLVTLKWWDDIWLNEAFAYWLQGRLTAKPNDPSRERGLGLELAAVSGSVQHTAKKLDGNNFQPIPALRKGEAVIALLEAHLGSDAWRAVLRDYLAAHIDGVVETTDLRAALVRRHPTISATFDRIAEDPAATIRNLELDCTHGPLLRFFASGATEMCIAYDRDGTRADVCTPVRPFDTSVSLPAKACPRWVYPNAGGLGIFSIDWPNDVADRVLATGWASLTAIERRSFYYDLDEPARKLAVFVRQLDGRDALDVRSIVAHLDHISAFVPNDLRVRFGKWIHARFATAALAAIDKVKDFEGDDLDLVMLFAHAHDPDVLAKLAALGTRFDRAVDALTKARSIAIALGDATIRKQLLLAKRKDALSATQLDALADVPGVIDDLEHQPEIIDAHGPGVMKFLFARTCDPSVRARLTALQPKHPFAAAGIQQIDDCIAKQRLLDPVFRSWLTKP